MAELTTLEEKLAEVLTAPCAAPSGTGATHRYVGKWLSCFARPPSG